MSRVPVRAETETREALHLAERLPELRRPCSMCFGRGKFDAYHDSIGALMPEKECHGCEGRGWLPNVTTDGLLEALPREWTVTFAAGTTYIDVPSLPYGFVARWEAAGRNLNALCAAAKQALSDA